MHTSRRYSAVFALCVIGSAPNIGFANCEPWSQQKAATQSLTVGSVQINNTDVFNAKAANENKSIHQLANKLHIESNRELIAAQLLFSQGDVFDLEALEETERNLRSNAYLRSASVTPKQICEGQVDILVETGDHWSLIPGFNFARAGGENAYSFRVAELNLLGLGKRLELQLDYSNERDQSILFYQDPMLFNSKTQFSLELQNNSDGVVQIIEFEQPFISLDTRRSWRVRAGNTEYLQNIYADGSVNDRLAVNREFFSLEYGYSNGKQNINTRTRVFRWRLGWKFNRTQLASSGLFADSAPTAERVFSYPFAQLTFLQPKFIKQTNMQLMESVEDIAIGHKFRARLGIASEQFGSSTDATVFETVYSKGWQPKPKFLALLKASSTGYATDNGIENGVSKATVQGYYFANRKHRFYASANVVAGNQLFENNQIVLGGETGLRGYPLRFQTGSRKAQLTAEQRYFLDWYPLRIARVGTAVFADVGSVWDKGEEPIWLKDVGFGLRIVGTRQADAKVMHIDFAFPLDAKDRIERFQFVVSAKTQF